MAISCMSLRTGIGYRAESSSSRAAISLAFLSFQTHMNLTLFRMTVEMALRCCELTQQLAARWRPRIMSVVRMLVELWSMGLSANSSMIIRICGRAFSVVESLSNLMFFFCLSISSIRPSSSHSALKLLDSRLLANYTTGSQELSMCIDGE